LVLWAKVEITMDTESKLEAHERECAIRYQTVQEKLDGLDKRLWRLEAMLMASTLTIVAASVGLFMK
jgi:hypothetical protein